MSDVECYICARACIADLGIFVRAHAMCMHVLGRRLHVPCFSGGAAFSESIPICRQLLERQLSLSLSSFEVCILPEKMLSFGYASRMRRRRCTCVVGAQSSGFYPDVRTGVIDFVCIASMMIHRQILMMLGGLFLCVNRHAMHANCAHSFVKTLFSSVAPSIFSYHSLMNAFAVLLCLRRAVRGGVFRYRHNRHDNGCVCIYTDSHPVALVAQVHIKTISTFYMYLFIFRCIIICVCMYVYAYRYIHIYI